MENYSEDKSKRILEIYTKLRQGKLVCKAALSKAYGVSQRTIQRDITDIQCFLQDQCMETGSIQEIIYDKREGGYLLRTKQNHYLREKEVMVICRILLGSRALVKDELFPIIQGLITVCSDDSKESAVKNLLQNGMQQYIEPEHDRKLIDQLWKLEHAVKGQRYIEIRYNDFDDRGEMAWKLKPMQVLFLESNFYLVAAILDACNGGEDEKIDEKRRKGKAVKPDVYQIDRIEECVVIEGQFRSV